MNIAAKVWAYDEPEPEGLFNKATCPEAPPNWFREEPEYAAELYALERGTHRGARTAYKINVLDEDGKLHRFEVEVAWQPNAIVRRAA